MTATELIREINSEELTLRSAHNDVEDGERFCALSNSLYARKVDTAYYRWQFFASPFPTVLSLAVTADGELAGCYGFQVRQCVSNGMTVASAIDIMVAPEFQGKGLFRRLSNYAVSQLEEYAPSAVFVMANARAAQAHTHGLGWQAVTKLADWMIATADMPNSVTPEIQLKTLTMLCAEEDHFLQMVSARRGKVGIGLARDTALWQWRFLDNPRYRYELFRAEHQGELVGLLALKLFRDPVTDECFGDIVDIAWREEEAAILPGLLMCGASHLRSQGAQQISTWLQTNTELDAAGRELGFQSTGRQRHLVCKPLDTRYLWLNDPARWCATMADTDMY